MELLGRPLLVGSAAWLAGLGRISVRFLCHPCLKVACFPVFKASVCTRDCHGWEGGWLVRNGFCKTWMGLKIWSVPFALCYAQGFLL